MAAQGGALPSTGVLGGSFDPVHAAHLALARTALEALRLDHLLWIPGGTPPHREAPRASTEQRLAMLERAIGIDPAAGATEAKATEAPRARQSARQSIDTRELHKRTPCYTVETLAELRAERGSQHALVLLIGGDQFARLAGWHRWTELFALAHIAVFTRPGWSVDAVADAAVRAQFDARRASPQDNWNTRAAGAVIPVPMAPMEVSSTAIRERLASGEDARGLLPAAVLDYIAREGLYGPAKP